MLTQSPCHPTDTQQTLMDPTIRLATPGDAEAIIRLNEAFNDVRDTVEGIRQRLEHARAIESVLLAEINEQAVGFLCLRLLPQVCDAKTYAEVSELFVDEPFRRQGVAQALMDRAAEMARTAGASELILLTNFRNTVAQRFYHAQEFENYALAMCKRL